MTTNILSLDAEIRTEIGSRPSKALRAKGRITATIYSKDRQPMSISLNSRDITKCYKQGHYISQVMEFNINGEKYKVLPKDINLHPVNEQIINADFVFLSDKYQVMQVPIVYLNKEQCLGVKKGGYFNTIRRLLKISCPVENMPRKIEVDVKSMPVAASIKIKDVIIPEGATLLENPNFVIASIIGKRGKDSDEGDSNREGGEDSTAAVS